MNKMNKENWSMKITPKRGLFNFNLREIIRYRELVFLFVKRDLITQFKQTLVGPLWYIITPIVSTVVYTFIFGRLAQIGTDGIPHTLFYYSGTLLWGFFSGCFSNSKNIFVSNAGLFGKIYFPRLIIPIYQVFSKTIKIFIQLIMLIVFQIYYLRMGAPLYPSWNVLFFPLILIWLAAAGTGAGIIISSITTK
jgi:lipopolysaccharide transport system permease protein